MLPLLAALISLSSGSTLDLGGTTIRCSVPGQIGIHAFGDGITIRNGTVIGCHIAILVEREVADYVPSAGVRKIGGAVEEIPYVLVDGQVP